jgi:hypothetical protein
MSNSGYGGGGSSDALLLMMCAALGAIRIRGRRVTRD